MEERMSLHTDRAYQKARAKGAAAAITYETWQTLMGYSKRELAEAAMHLAAQTTGRYDESCDDGNAEVPSALAQVQEEMAALKSNGAV